MAIQRISGGSKFEDIIGYSRVVVDQGLVTVSGTAGFDYSDGSIAEDVAAQARQAFLNLTDYLSKANCTLADIVRATVILTDAAEWEAIVPVIGENFQSVKPALTAFVAGLVDPRMKIEIEVAARQPTE
jgi:enamine deaminase RidA (YjgF/YER057c/UK114 family)